MKLLLDTNVFIWLMSSPTRVQSQEAILKDPANELLVSAVCAWEIAIKHALGRLPLPDAPAAYVPGSVRYLGATPVAITHEQALGVAALPLVHGDPFDRLLVAQALALDATLVTGDVVLARYPCETLLV